MNKDRPFDKLILYLSTILDEGDYVDIFYIPMILKESYRLDTIDRDGLLRLSSTSKYPTKYPLSKYTTMVFINGYKVNPLEIKDISINQMLINVDKYVRDSEGNKINNYGYWETVPYTIPSINNITVMEYIEGDEDISNYLDEGNYDSWRTYIETLQNSEYRLKSIYGKYYEIENQDIEPNYKIYFGGLRSILYDIIIDYYLVRNEAATGEAFIYDFERAEWEPYSRYSGNENLDSVDNVKLITVFPDHDKLLDYIPTTDNIADTGNVLEGMLFYPADTGN